MENSIEQILIGRILREKENAIQQLLNKTESPIEKIFLLEFLRYLEHALSESETNIKFPFAKIDGYTYIQKMVKLGVDYVFTDELLGVKIKYTQFEAPLSESVKESSISSTSKRKREKLNLSTDRELIYQELDFFPQYSLIIKDQKFRLDFAFILTEASNSSRSFKKKVGIECDGYKFHSSPDQFVKDRERMRLLQSDDWTMIHFSGSEIYKGSTNYEAEFDRILSILGFSTFGYADETKSMLK